LRRFEGAGANSMMIWYLARQNVFVMQVVGNLRLKKRLIGHGGIRELVER
jgi:hypothetical protein